MDFHPYSGQVILVGAGPGAADLLTVRAVKALAEIELVRLSRLSVAAIRPGEWDRVLELAKT